MCRTDGPVQAGNLLGNRLRGLVLTGDAASSDLAAFWRGDERALEAVYRRHARELLASVRALVGAAEAESVVHEVFVELLRNEEMRRRFTGGALGAWLTAIARLKGMEHLRRTGRMVPDSERLPEGADAPPEPRLEARDILVRFLAKAVPPQQVAFFRMRFLDCRTQVEVATALGIARSTLEGWEHRLSDKLRRFIWESAR